MKFYKIQMLGRFIAEYVANVAGLSYSASLDKGRILYDETTNRLYYGDNSGGGQFSRVGGAADVTYENLNANGDVGTGATQVSQGNHAHGSYISAADVTYENLNANGDVGTGATQVSQGNHGHTAGEISGLTQDSVFIPFYYFFRIENVIGADIGWDEDPQYYSHPIFGTNYQIKMYTNVHTNNLCKGYLKIPASATTFTIAFWATAYYSAGSTKVTLGGLPIVSTPIPAGVLTLTTATFNVTSLRGTTQIITIGGSGGGSYSISIQGPGVLRINPSQGGVYPIGSIATAPYDYAFFA